LRNRAAGGIVLRKETTMAQNHPEPHDLDGRMVEITGGAEGFLGFVGRAVDLGEHGWISVWLDATDPEDDRVVEPLGADDVTLRPDLED
jgi:hypothetical protein